MFFQRNGILAWIVCIGLCIVNTINLGIDNVFGEILDHIASEFRTSRGSVALVAGVHSFTTFVAAFICSFLAKIFSFRTLIFVGGAVCCVAYVISSYCQNVISLALAYGFIGGFGSGSLHNLGVIACGYYFDSKQRAFATGLATSGVGAGTILVPLLVNYINEKYGWRSSMLSFTIMSPIVCLISFMLFPIIIASEEEINAPQMHKPVSEEKGNEKN